MLDYMLVEKMNLHNAEVLRLTTLPKRNHIHTATASNKENFKATARKKIDQLYSYTKEYGIQINGDPLDVIHKRENNNQNFLFYGDLAEIEGYELNLENPQIVIDVFKSCYTEKPALIAN